MSARDEGYLPSIAANPGGSSSFESIVDVRVAAVRATDQLALAPACPGREVQ